MRTRKGEAKQEATEARHCEAERRSNRSAAEFGAANPVFALAFPFSLDCFVNARNDVRLLQVSNDMLFLCNY
ncbi:MAG: hypothetical protein LBH30_00280 [Prevotellaceae bacterium]|nr:hypothetical protein [Prevotellaceae bacterium]